MKPYRQGDILFVPVENDLITIGKTVGDEYDFSRRRVRTVRRKKGGGIVVAEGEATGHHHRIRDVNSRLLSNGVRRFVRTGNDGAIVSHEEHDDLALPGDSTFEIVHQREHEPPKRQRGGGSSAPSTRQVWD